MKVEDDSVHGLREGWPVSFRVLEEFSGLHI